MTKENSVPAELMVDKERASIAINASCEIEELAMLLSKELSDRAEIGNLALIGITKLIIRLNSIIMSAISDKFETTDSLAERFP